MTRPFIIGEGLFPERQTGLQVLGSLPLGPVTLGYHLTLSNGRGSIAAYQDQDRNKAVGGRLQLTQEGRTLRVTAGVSGYYGRDTSTTIGVAGAGLTREVSRELDELAYAADLRLRFRGLQLQGELIAQEGAFTDAGRPRPSLPGAEGRVPDFRRWGAYGLAGYHLPWWPVMPFLLLEYIDVGADVPVDTGFTVGRVVALAGGLNLRPVDRVTFKLELTHVRLDGGGRLNSFASQVAWSY